MDKELYQALFNSLVEKLLLGKQKHCEIVLAGDSNGDLYRGKFSERLTKDGFNMTEQILKTTDGKIPPTLDRDPKVICSLLATAWGEFNTTEVPK